MGFNVSPRALRAAFAEEKSTKSKLILDPEGSESLLIDEEGHTVAIVAYRHSRGGIGTDAGNLEEKRANCERLVACWNLCAGIPTSSLQGAASLYELLTTAAHASSFLPSPDDLGQRDLKREVEELLSTFRPRNSATVTSVAAVMNPFAAANITDDNTPLYDVSDRWERSNGFHDPALSIPAPKDMNDGWAHSGVDDSTAGLIKELDGFFSDDRHEMLMTAFAEQRELAQRSVGVITAPATVTAEQIEELRAHCEAAKRDPDYAILSVSPSDEAIHAGSRVKAVNESIEQAYGMVRSQIAVGLGIAPSALTGNCICEGSKSGHDAGCPKAAKA